jgi:serine/threonine protein kinase
MSAESADLLRIAAAVSDGQAVDWDLESRRTGADVRSVTGLRDIERIVQACRSAASDDQIDEATQTLGDPRVGTRLDVEGPSAERWGPLQRLRPIGRGAFGTVYRAWDSRLEREVALKLFRVSPSRGTPTVEEGRLLARVRHANVVTVYGAEEHDGWIGIWMELIDGRSLDSVLTDHGPFAPRETALIGIELCHALAAVHRAGLVHGDVKAQNVMRETGGRIVLTDFGAGREGSAETASATLSGTPLYMAPELLTGGHPSAATDLYALGVLLFYLLSGEHPVTAQNLLELRSAHERGERKRLRDVRPDVSPAIARVVERAINPDPAARYSTAGAFEEALAEAMSEKAASVDRGVRRLFGVARVSRCI